LGVVAATAGMFIHFSAYQQILSLLIGCVLLLTGVGQIRGVRIPLLSSVILHVTSWIKKKFGAILQRRNFWSSILLGMLNGLLPCGLTYLAMTYCLTLDTWWQGFIFMFFFGLGTWPVMLGITSVLGFSAGFFNRNLSRMTTILFVLSGCLLIGRAVFTHEHHDLNPAGELVQSEVICR
jgi:sulfite exporter TauE/SafE